MTINGKIHTTLTMKEVAYITSALSVQVERIGDTDPELKKDYNKIVNRLGAELYDHPNEDHTKK